MANMALCVCRLFGFIAISPDWKASLNMKEWFVMRFVPRGAVIRDFGEKQFKRTDMIILLIDNGILLMSLAAP
jgi:hypothetical protein